MSTERIDESTIGDLRASDLINYFKWSNRYSQCPHCPHTGNWEFHIKLDPVTNMGEEDPVLIPFTMGMLDNNGNTIRCAAITCPNCGHFSLISMYKIAVFKQRRAVHRG